MKKLLNKMKEFFKEIKHIVYTCLIGSIILVLAIVVVITATASDANRFEYELMEDGTYKVVDLKNTYRGGIFFRDDLVIPSEYKGKQVSTVEKIRSTHLTKITLEEGIKEIGNNAFSGLKLLEEVDLPNSLTTIKNNAFENCPNLKNVYIPSGVTSMGETIGCNNLDIVFYVSGTSQAGWNKNWNAMGFDELKNGIYRPTYYNVEEGSFYTVGDYEYLVTGTTATITNCYSTLEEIEVSDKVLINGKEYTVNKVGEYSFDNLKTLKKVILPTSITSIERNVFEGCTELLHTHFGTNIEYVGANVFKNCASVVAYVEKTEEETTSWDENWNLWAEVDGENEYRPSYYGVGANDFETIDGYECIFDENDNLTIVYYRLSNENVVVPASLSSNGKTYSVVNIGKLGFANQKTIKSITLPSTIKTIGEGAFTNCYLLEKIYLSDNIEFVGKNAFTECLELVIYTTKSENMVEAWGEKWDSGRPVYFNVENENQIIVVDQYFEYLITGADTAIFTKYRAVYKEMLGNTNLKNVVINELTYNNKTYKVTEIGAYALEGKLNALTSVTLGENVTKVGSKAFYDCTKVKTFVFSKNLVSLAEDAIDESYESTIYFDGSQQQWLENNPYSVVDAETNTVTVVYSILYFYSETNPVEEQKLGNYWHYENDAITEWEAYTPAE